MLILELLQHQLVSLCYLLSQALPPLLQITVVECGGRWSNWVFGSYVRSPFFIVHEQLCFCVSLVTRLPTTDDNDYPLELPWIRFPFRFVLSCVPFIHSRRRQSFSVSVRVVLVQWSSLWWMDGSIFLVLGQHRTGQSMNVLWKLHHGGSLCCCRCCGWFVGRGLCIFYFLPSVHPPTNIGPCTNYIKYQWQRNEGESFERGIIQLDTRIRAVGHWASELVKCLPGWVNRTCREIPFHVKCLSLSLRRCILCTCPSPYVLSCQHLLSSCSWNLSLPNRLSHRHITVSDVKKQRRRILLLKLLFLGSFRFSAEASSFHDPLRDDLQGM